MGFKIFENNLLIKVMLNFFYSQNAYFLKCIETSFFWVGGGVKLHFSLIYCCFPSQKYAYHLFSLAIKVINKDNGYKTNFI